MKAYNNMAILDYINNTDKTAFSFEIVPPLKGMGINRLYENIQNLMEFNPKYINITSRRSEYVYKKLADGNFKRYSVRTRPGTVAVAAAIKHKFNVPVVPHVLCGGFTREETEYLLIDLQFLGITDILVLRGDKAKDQSRFTPCGDGYNHAIELQEQINNFSNGLFIDSEKMKWDIKPFTYGVACYPEKHEEAPNIENDIYWLKKKVEAGAQYAVTQMFFDNKKYFDFVERVRKEGINVPIIPGIKPLGKLPQLNILPKTFKIDLPQELTSEATKCKTDEEMKALGVEWSIHQCKELIEYKVPSIHFYSIGATDSIQKIAKQIY